MKDKRLKRDSEWQGLDSLGEMSALHVSLLMSFMIIKPMSPKWLWFFRTTSWFCFFFFFKSNNNTPGLLLWKYSFREFFWAIEQKIFTRKVLHIQSLKTYTNLHELNFKLNVFSFSIYRKGAKTLSVSLGLLDILQEEGFSWGRGFSFRSKRSLTKGNEQNLKSGRFWLDSDNCVS